MKFRIPQRILSPDFWFRAFVVPAAGGMATAIVGFVVKSPLLVRVGAWLCAPLILAAILIVVVVMPILIVANRRQRK